MRVYPSVVLIPWETEFNDQYRSLLEARSRIIVMLSSQAVASRFLSGSIAARVGGPGYLWFVSDAIANEDTWQVDPGLSTDLNLRTQVFKGMFGVIPSPSVSAAFSSFLDRRRTLLVQETDSNGCNLGKDDSGNYVFQRYTDGNASSSPVCVSLGDSAVSHYAPYAYDAATALAHAFHDLLEVQNRTEIVGSELLDTLITRVRFEGVSGLIDFYDASADPDLLYHGDRRVGVTYELVNYVDASQGFVAVGTWQPCGADAGCSWSEQWHEEPGVAPTFSTADNRKPSQVAQTISEVRIGVLLGMFLTAEGGYQKLEWSPRVGVFQALREFNNKTDGVADDLLPGIRLRVAFQDAKCDAATALQSSLRLLDAFDSDGVSAIIGASCSGASVTAAQVALGAGVPIISPSSTSPVLSDGRKYPYFLRVAPSDAFAAVAMLRVLQRLWNYTAASLVHSTDAYGSGLADALSAAALDSGFTIGVTLRFAKDTTDFRLQQLTLRRSSARVILLSCQISDGSRFLRSAYESGVGGEGYLFIGGDTFYDSGLWEGDVLLSSNIALRESVLRGLFCVFPRSRNVGAPRYESYLARRKQLPPIGDDTDCNLETDDTGTLLWAQDHDNTASTPLKCDTRDLSHDGVYDALGYDAVFAILYALHDLLEVQNRTEIVGSELLDTLITRVRFEGVSGLVDFYDASADPDLLYHGDRRVGVTYELINYVDASQGFVAVGTWQPCGADAGCSWSEQWHEEPGVAPTFSTADNRKPSQVAQEAISEVRIGVLLGMFLTAEGGYQKLEWSPRVGVFQALREFNNKTDGVADDLLPGIRLRVAFQDAKCDAATALQSSLRLLDAFDSDGVSAIIGAGCSGASVTAAQVAQGAGLPIISPSSTSPVLSDGRKYPYFLRVAPSDAFAAVAMLRVLQRLWNYTAASLVHSTDAYGSGLADALSAAALDSGFTIGVTVRFAKDTTDFRLQQLTLRRSSARVILLSCQINDGSRFLRSAYESGVGGEGYLFIGGDTFYDSGLWEGDVLLSSNIALRESVLRGLFCVSPRSRNVGAPRYESYLARRKQLPPIGDDTDCNLETDDTGTLLWAQDHDNTASTPLKCDTRDLSHDGVYDALGYDAVFAILYALHDLLEVQNRTEIVGSELLDTLITRVRFEGVSGLVDFYDASADPDLLYHGDRRVGVTYELINYVDASQGFVAVGTWQPCGADAGCSWSEQWHEEPGVAPTFSTVGNAPQQSTTAQRCSFGEVLDEHGLCVCSNGFQLDEASQQCQPCPLGQYSLRATDGSNSSDGCTLCADSFFRGYPQLPASECRSCDEIIGISCSNNATLESVHVQQGFWRLSPSSLDLRECPSGQGTSPCSGGSDAGIDGTGYCRGGHTGPRCELCINASKFFSNGECLDCPSSEWRLTLWAGAILGACIFAGVIFVTASRLHLGRLRHSAHVFTHLRMRVHSLALVPKGKQAIAFCQMVSLMPVVYDISLPNNYYDWLGFLNIFEVDWADLLLPSTCLQNGYYDSLLLRAMAPFLLSTLVIVVYMALSVCPYLIGFRHGHIPWLKALLDSLPLLLFIAFVFTPTTSTSVFAAWSCESFEVDSLSQPPVTVKYLRGDLSIQCDQSNDDYSRITVLAYILVAIWSIGVPLSLLLVLVLNRQSIAFGRSTRIVGATRFLCCEYHKEYYWWEVLYLVQRLVLVGFLTWVSHPPHRLLLANIVALAYLVVLLALQPYKRADVRVMAQCSQIAVVIFLFLATFVRNFIKLEDAQQQSISYDLLGFDSLDSLVATFAMVVIGFLVTFVVFTIYHALTTRNISLLRLERTGYPPELSLDQEKLFHLFLSHTWTSGQDQVAAIKRSLQLMVPGCRIFLDVDDLEDVGLLEKYVLASQSILLFLSKGYFHSPNCLREVKHALRSKIALIRVHEADSDRGGAPLPVIRAEAESVAEDVDLDKEVIVWYRAHEFQMLSLKSVARQMLHSMPMYRQDPIPPRVFVLGELEDTSMLEFKKPVTCYVSDFNPAASVVVDVLTARWPSRQITISRTLPAQLNISFFEASCNDSFRGQPLNLPFSSFSAKIGAQLRRRLLARADASVPSSPNRARNTTIRCMLLYLNNDTFTGVDGRKLAAEVRAFRSMGIDIVLVHENEEQYYGCPFARVIEMTPHDLVHDGLYTKLAIEFHPHPYREVSLALLAKALGAKHCNKTSKRFNRISVSSAAACCSSPQRSSVSEGWPETSSLSSAYTSVSHQQSKSKNRLPAKIRWRRKQMKFSADVSI